MSTFASSPSQQIFSVPYNFVLYMIENPATPEVLENLYQTCKFFWSKNQIVTTDYVICRVYGMIYKLEEANELIERKSVKCWPTMTLRIQGKIDYIKFFRFSPKLLEVEFVNLPFREFNLIVAENTVERFHIVRAKIEGATVDVVLEKSQTAFEFVYNNEEEVYSGETLQTLNLIERSVKFTSFKLYISKVSKGFAPWLLVNFMENNCCSKSAFDFYFDFPFSHLKAEFMEIIQQRNATKPNFFTFINFNDRIRVVVVSAEK